ncbi:MULTISPECIES: M15 family metallopeptidase [Bacillus]|uniref:Peptidase M15 n=2 Tax=Bacillus TaxID=1386 RepID=A0A0M3RAS8_9BACI|nr:peptidase M15 [Bacillus gobiensis]MBP1083935.1 peptidoglycan L-alanyl-D-glutamate endopeptidase CwlK [Bacillus capparidis]
MKRFLQVLFVGSLLIFIASTLIYAKDSTEPSLQDVKDAPLPTELHPVVAENRDKLANRAKEIGISIVITDDFRSFEEQDKLYAKGRTTKGSIVTYAKGGESYHNYGLAIDFALRLNNGNVSWDMEYDGNKNGTSDWMEVVKIAKELGFEWGGDWSGFKDYPHLQMIPETD